MAEPANMPAWPYRMPADMAAAFCGVSTSKFLARVKDGTYPQPYRDGGNRLWYQDELRDAMDRLRGLPTSSAGDPFAEALDGGGPAQK